MISVGRESSLAMSVEEGNLSQLANCKGINFEYHPGNLTYRQVDTWYLCGAEIAMALVIN
jgi:hypothetical protein